MTIALILAIVVLAAAFCVVLAANSEVREERDELQRSLDGSRQLVERTMAEKHAAQDDRDLAIDRLTEVLDKCNEPAWDVKPVIAARKVPRKKKGQRK